MSEPNIQLNQNNNEQLQQPEQLQQQNPVLQQQNAALQQQNEEPVLFQWQDQGSFYDSVSTKDQKKRYKFRMMDTKKIKEILSSETYKNDKTAEEKITTKKSELKFQDQRKVKDRLFDANASILKKDKKSWWRKDSTKMQNIKIAMDRVQMLMQTDLRSNPEFLIDGKLNFEKISSVLKEEFQKAIDFCDEYLNDPKKQGTGSTATRRRGHVQTCREMMMKELNTFRILGQPDIELTLIGSQDNIRTPRDILMGIKVITVGNVQHQNQGNSQEVYVVDVNKTDVDGRHVEAKNENGEVVRYYMKENLPMLDKTTDLYLDRRIKELEKGKEYKNSPNERNKEEYRMKKSGADDIDYDNGKRFLEAAKHEITTGKKEKRDAARKDFCDFLAHDFDSLFREYEEYKRLLNKGANGVEPLSREEMAALKNQAQNDPIKALLYEALYHQMMGEQVEKLGPFEWLVRTGIIKENTKDPLYNILKEISQQPDVMRDGKMTSRLEVLLRVTTGKEAELFGQMTARAKGGTDMSQYLTMMTSEMGSVYGFDVLCKTYMAVTDFERWNEENAVGSVVTLQEEAKGMEWIELQKEAMKNGKKVRLSPNAARQMISLQVIDTISAQTDRHGRNFKCEYAEKDGYYVVKSIKAYDHDMSFSEVTPEKAFEEEKGKDGKTKKLKKNGFLPPMIQKITPSSPLFRYIRRSYLHKKKEHGWLDDVKPAMYDKPLKVKDPKTGEYVEKTERTLIPSRAKDALLTVFYKSALSFNKRDKSKRADYHNVVNQPKDIYDRSWVRQGDKCNFVMKRDKKLNINITEDLFSAKPTWVKKIDDLDNMPYEEFAQKIDEDTAESLRIEKATDDEVQAVKALWKFSRIISELGRLMIPPAEGNKEYEYTGNDLFGNDRNLFYSSLVMKRNYTGDGLVTYSEEDKQRILELGKQLKDLNDQWDFTGLYINYKTACGYSFQGTDSYTRDKESFRMPEKDRITGMYLNDSQIGYFDGYIQATLEYIATMFKDDPVINHMNEQVPDELKEFYDEESNTLSLPSVLHMDEEDYKRAQLIVADFENGTLKARMQARQLSEKSINAAFLRAKDTVAKINKMKDMAEKLLRLKYPDLWERDKNKPAKDWDPKLRFFLSAKEFEDLNDLSDLALDPGDTYLVQDDDDYMSTQDAFKECMTRSEQKDAKDRRKKAYLDQKRWMGTENPEENFKTDGSSVDMKLGKIEAPGNAA
ncbi:MAG: hypothetical protein IJ857_09345 [Lachnospiraceae bacterium]|nr:hypothetical protein [Lachnospiraceae bacterium]